MASIGSTSASNIYNALGASNKGIGGLATGLDTDSLVAALTAGTKAKIARQTQDKQLLNWKMTAYRSMSTALKAFQSKSFAYNSASPTSNIMSSSFFNTYKATSSSTKVSVSAGTSAVTGNVTIDKINKLATAESVSSKTGLSTELLLDVDDDVKKGSFSGETLKFTFGSSVKTIKLDTLNDTAFDAEGNFDADAFKTELQRLIDVAVPKKSVYNETTKEYDTLVSNVVLTKTDDGKFTLDSDSGKVTIEADNDIFGIKGGDSNRLSLNTKIGAIDQFKGVLQGDVMKFNINGTEISVNKDETLNNLMTKINGSNANVRMSYSVYTDEFTLTSKVTGGGDNIDMRDVQGNLMNTLFGAQSGNSIGTGYLTTKGTPTSQGSNLLAGYESGSVEMKTLGGKLKNMNFEMTINGVTKTVNLDVSKIDDAKLKNGTFGVTDIYNAMNKGIETAFGTTDVKFSAGADGKTVISSPSGTAVSLNKGGLDRGGIMDVLGFSEPTGNGVINLDYEQEILGSGSLLTSGLSAGIASGKTGTLEMTINGETKQLEVTGGINYANFENQLTDAITKAFGKEVAGKINVTGKYVGEGEGRIPVLKLEVSDPNMSVSMGHGSSLAGKVDMYDMLGLSGTTTNNNKADNNSVTFGDLTSSQNLTAGKLVIDDGAGNNIEVEYSKDMSLQDFMNEISTKSNGAISAGINNGQLSITTKSGTVSISDYKQSSAAVVDDETGEITQAATYESNVTDSGILKDVFGVTGGEIKTIDKSPDMKVTAGQNAEIVVDGHVLSQESNTFTINGISITVNEVSGKDDAAIKIDVQSDPEDVVTKIKAWMDDYNAMVFTLNTMVNESKNRDYAPLTEEQKADMTEDQIKTWETEAKKGVLRNDNTLKDILSQLRNTLYEKVESAGISLYDIGITTKSFAGPNEAGMIEFDKNVSGGGEAKLRAMLTSDPDKVRSLFTAADTGVAVRMNDIITKASNTSSVDQGSLVRLAGSEILTGNNTSILGDKISAIDKFIASLSSRMEAEYNRQWKKFSALEVAVQRMSAQSSWLNQS